MSYKAFGKLKEFVEVEFLRTLSYEEINKIICDLNDKNETLQKYRNECEQEIGSMRLEASKNNLHKLPQMLDALCEKLDRVDNHDKHTKDTSS